VTRYDLARTGVLSALLLVGAVGLAEARNPHCAGGIQYVVQAMRDKEKGNLEDYKREINKAVEQLQQCAAEDPADFEAIGYLGWALAEVESTCAAGKAFQASIEGLEKKGDKKKDMVATNRTSYWTKAYNEGIQKIQTAQQAYPEYCKTPENDAEKAKKAEAQTAYAAAIASLNRARCLNPNDPGTLRNLGTAHALQCEYEQAEALFLEGLKVAPNDSTLQQSLKSVRTNKSNRMVENKDYDAALKNYTDLVKNDPNNAELYSAIGDVHFKRAQDLKDDARKTEFVAAGDGYAKAGDLNTTNADLPFNAGLAYTNAAAWDKAETQWRKVLKIRADDVDALSSLGSVLAEQKKCPEAVEAVSKAVTIKPKEKTYHRQLGAIYTKCGNNAKATEELMVYLSMNTGKPAPDASGQSKGAKAGSDAAKTASGEGAPEEIYLWEADGQKYETWFYWNKNKAFTFGNGSLVTKSDWGASAGGKK
jgi:tetratricopeptide (TPR) repeat protein